MIKNFPEIQRFFKSNRFSGEELKELFETIDYVYQNHQVNAQAKALIKLELLKFELQSKEKNTTPRSQKNKLPSVEQTTPSKIDVTSKDVSRNNKLTPSQFISIRMRSITKGNYRNAAKELELTVPFVIKLLRKKGFYNVKQFDQVGNEVLHKMQGFIQHRLSMLYQSKFRKKKKGPALNKHQKNSGPSASPGVYGRLEKLGLGKVIYIRSR